MANESAGWLRYKLPEVFFWIFLSTGIASPFLGIGTLVFCGYSGDGGISGRRQDGPKDENCAHPRGSDRDRCPGCLDRPVQRGLFRSGREPVEDELARGPVFLENSLSIY